MNRNLHKYYYKDYFGNRPEEIIDPEDRQQRRRINASLNWMDIKSDKKNAPIIKKRNSRLMEREILYVIEKPMDTKYTFQLEIVYPGLVTGIGINHEATIEGEFKLGVHFDWTYGMPVVYGSSVKGVLRSAFICKQKQGKIIEYEDYFLKEVTNREWNQEEIKTLFDAIFEGKDEKGNNLSIYNRDIFFDAVIVKPDTNGRILCSDSITPHGDNPLKNPIPITFLKIAPGCKMEFRFKLEDSIVNGKLFRKEDKIKLFKEILTTVGIGAKTNVGYGQLK